MALFTSSMTFKSLIFVLLAISLYKGRKAEARVQCHYKCMDCTSGKAVNSKDVQDSCAAPPSLACNLTSEDVIISDGGFYVDPDCTKRAHCISGNVTWDDAYNCSANADCEDQDNVRQCYCKDGYYGDGQTCERPIDCQAVRNADVTVSGIYIIKPTNWSGSSFDVYCNMTGVEGWTVFQRRVNGSVDFYRDWASYKEGFGKLDHEFWLGNDKLYYLTNQGNYSLQIDMVNRDGDPYYTQYNLFRINDESDNYRLSALGTGNGPAGDALLYHLDSAFSTYDRDNDGKPPELNSCAVSRRGAWWYNSCCASNLNGDYNAAQTNDACCYGQRSLCWRYIPGPDKNLQYTEMKIRPV